MTTTKESMGERLRRHPIVSLVLTAGALIGAVAGAISLWKAIFPPDLADRATLSIEVGPVMSLQEYSQLFAEDTEAFAFGPPAEVGKAAYAPTGAGTAALATASVVLVPGSEAGTPDPAVTPGPIPSEYLDLMWAQQALEAYLPLRDALEATTPQLTSTSSGATTVKAYDNEGNLRPETEVAAELAAQLANSVVVQTGETTSLPMTKVTAPYSVAEAVSLNVRERPTAESSSVAILPGGAAVSVACVTTGQEVTSAAGSSRDWYRIDQPAPGYVAAAFIVAGEAAAAPLSCDEASTSASTGAFAVADINWLNVRLTPSLDGEPTSGLEGGTAINVHCVATGPEVSGPSGATSAWYQIIAPVQGYVSAAYVVAADGTPTPSACAGNDQSAETQEVGLQVQDAGGLAVTVDVDLDGFAGESLNLTWAMTGVDNAVNSQGNLRVLDPSTNDDGTSIVLWFPFLADRSEYAVHFRITDASDPTVTYDSEVVTVSKGDGAA